MRALTAALALWVIAADCIHAQTDAAHELERQVRALRDSGSVDVGGIVLTSTSGIIELYEANAFEPLWTNTRAADLDAVVRSVETDGLDPAAYHQRVIQVLDEARPSPLTEARLDLIRSDALLRLVRDLQFGRTHSQALADSEHRDSIASWIPMLRTAILTRRLASVVDARRPKHFVYQGLVDALSDLRRIERRGGWNPIPAGRLLRRDSVDARVASLRSRLVAEGYDTGAATRQEDYFDGDLEAAVRSFQHRHGLNEDGIVGTATLSELNVSVTRRIDQVRANLERARWIAHDLPDTFLAVNIAGAKVYLVRDGNVVLESRAVVGSTSTTTPVFRATMTHVDLNPTWTVPPGIVAEVLAAVRRDPRYLDRNGFAILDGRGRRVDASGISFERYTARTFPYVFRQEPGPANPLGRIKFVFPNPYNVYLHDTPARELFDRERRTFSHGCIRVENVLRLAELVLDDPARTPDALEAEMGDGRTRTIRLKRPLPVLILYWTASADLHGDLHYYRDVYGRDEGLLRDLDGR